MSVKSERAWEKLWKVEQLQTKIRQLEEDYDDYRILAQTKIRQLEAEKLQWFNSSRDADLECIRLRREIKQLKEEFEMITKDRDDRVHELYESNEENQRLTEAIEFEINQPMQIARQQERLQKALKGE